MFSNDIVGTSDAHDGTPPDPRTVRLFVEGVPTAETAAAGQRPAGRSAARTTARRGSSAGSSGDVAENPQTGMQIRVVWRRDRYLRGSDHISFLLRGYPAARFTEPRENFAHQHQDVRVENGVQYGDLVEFCDFALHRPGGPGERRGPVVAGPGARARRSGVRHRHHRS